MKKRILSLLLALAMLFSLMPQITLTAQAATGGTYENITWKLNGRTLVISGTGDMPDFEEYYDTPWFEYWCSGNQSGGFIQTVQIESGITSVGKNAFSGGHDLKSIQLADTVTRIGDYAFDSNVMTYVSIPSSVKEIGDFAFAWCYDLRVVKLAEGLERIGENAFLSCDSLKNVTIPASVTEFGDMDDPAAESPFAECEGMTAFTVADGSTILSAQDGVLFNRDMTRLIQYPLNKDVTEYTVPEGVESIGNKAFGYSRKLQSLTLPSSLKVIYENAFHYSPALKELTFRSKAPEMRTDNMFFANHMTVYYPSDDPTWTEKIRGNYGGIISWQAMEHVYENDVCVNCGRRNLTEGWLEPEFAQGDYTMVVIPDPQRLVNYWPEDYYAMMQWIADNQDELNIQAVMHMGDMVDTSNDTQWEIAKNGMDIIDDAGIPWMPMMGNHDESGLFNEYFDYASYGTSQSWFGGSYQEGKLDHTYWFVNAGQREYLILSLGWAPKRNVISWAQRIVERYPEKNVILNLHAYMNADGDLVTKKDLLAGMYGDYDINSIPSSYLDMLMKDYPDSEEIWDTFSQYENVVLVSCGHVHSQDIVTRKDTNAAGKKVTSLLIDRQNDDTQDRLGMVAVLTFHNDSDSVDVNWYSTRLDALYGSGNQFSFTVPHVCSHKYETQVTEPTCTEQGYTVHTCAYCGDSYTDSYFPALGHSYGDWTVVIPGDCEGNAEGEEMRVCDACGEVEINVIAPGHRYIPVVTEVTCLDSGYTTHTCQWCGDSYMDSYVDPLGHDFSKYVSNGDATCINDGTKTAKCSRCDMTDTVTDKGSVKGHSFTQWSYTKEPTCTEDGIQISKCDRCDVTKTETRKDSALGHAFTKWDYIQQITCTKDGIRISQCDRCDVTKTVTDEGSATGHTMGSWIVIKIPTCTEKGYEQRNCANCDYFETKDHAALGHKYEDGQWIVVKKANCIEDGEKELKCDRCNQAQKESIPALGHHYGETVETKPTCLASGYTTHICLRCGDSYMDSYIKPLGHSFTKYVSDNNATCTGDGTKTAKCDRCDVTKTVTDKGTAKGHSFTRWSYAKDPTCTEDGSLISKCDRCGVSSIKSDFGSALGHTYGHWFVVKLPTCGEAGREERTCSRCGHVDFRVLGTLEHKYAPGQAEPTCTDKGYTGQICTVCGHIIPDSEVPALGHSFTEYVSNADATCLEDGTKTAKCDRCDETDTKADPGSALGHSYSEAVTEATCLEGGFTTFTCDVCEYTYVDEYVEALGHSFTEYVSNADATCLEDGTVTAKCDRCDETDTQPDPGSAPGHSYVAVVTDPTCTQRGYTTHTCHCGDSYVDGDTSALGHSYIVTEYEATCTVGGFNTNFCSRCGDYYVSDEKEALGHAYEALVTDPTCTEGGYTLYTCRCGDQYRADETAALGHDWDEGFVTMEPTEEETGIRVFTCGSCGEVETEILPALGHVHSYETEVIAATCTEGGYTLYTCRCGDQYRADEIAPRGHRFGGWVVTESAGCTEDGLQIRECLRCWETEEKIIPAIGHDYEGVVTKPDCLTGGYTTFVCGNCGHTYEDDITPAAGHSYETKVVHPTCTKSGYTTYTCTACGDSYDADQTEPTGHRYNLNVIEPGCVEGGCTIHICVGCFTSYSDQETAALGHDWDEGVITLEPTEDVEGERTLTCQRCGGTEIQYLPKLDHVHSFESVVTEATCIEGGFITHSCRCGETYKTDQTEPTGHSFGQWYIYQDSTCTELGEMRQECENCGTWLTETIELKNHVFNRYISNENATCTTDSTKTAVCENCGISDTVAETGTAKGHTYSAWSVLRPATANKEGEKVRICVICGTMEKRPIPKITEFKDVNEDAYYAQPILWAIGNGITNGISEDQFGPNEECTRNQIVTFLWRAAGSPEPVSRINPFVDVKESDYFYDAVLWAVEEGITTGLDDTHFGPNATCTRAQVAMFLWRDQGTPTPEGVNPFEDVTAQQWFYEAVLWAVENGITTGMDNLHFAPDSICTRGQIVTLLYRALA